MQRRSCKLHICEEIITNILNRLPPKSLARFICISEDWRKYIAQIYHCRLQWPQPYLICFFCVEKRLQSRFFFSSKESSLVIGTSLDESVSLIGERVYVVASSSGFLLCNKLKSRQRIYYVYNPATRQRFDVPKTRILMNDPRVGFMVKETNESVSFTIVRYGVHRAYFHHLYSSVTIEIFSSETNIWTANKLTVDERLLFYPYRDETSSSSACVVDRVFCWLCNYPQQVTVYDSVKKCFWALGLPDWTWFLYPGYSCLGLSGGELCFASNGVWVWKYDIDVATVVQKCREDFGLGGGNALGFKVQSMVFHPALPDILYLQIRSKVISYDMKTSSAELVHDFGEAWRKTVHYKLFSYEWPQWPHLQ
ncbi:F-box protein like [Capsicum galapagoense]